jgi:hypothetical protein
MRRLTLHAAIALAAFVAPLLASRYGGGALGRPLFDAPWLALHFANVVVGAALLAAAVAIALRRRSDGGELSAAAAIALCAGTFGLALALKMDSGVSSDVLLFGLLPASDAQNYYDGAMSYLAAGQLSEWTTRRPFAAMQLAGLFTLSGDGLRRSVALLGAACAAGSLLVLWPLFRRFGFASAAAGFAALFAFIHLTLGTTMSESLGFALGCAGFALLADAAFSGRRALALAGLAFLSFALATRAGALFVLPALALWCGWRFRATDGAMSWRMAALGLAAGAAGFIVNKALVTFAGMPGQLPFGNFAFTLYGLAIGGESWTRFFADFPQYVGVSEGEQAAAAYRAALAHMQAAPFDLIKGVAARYNDFLINTGWHKYVPNMLLRGLILLLALIGVVACWRTRSANLSALLLTGLAGILLSVPFLGDGGSRVYAATHPFSAAFVAVGAYVVQRWLAKTPFAAQPPPAGAPLLAVALGLLLLLPVGLALLHAPRGAAAASRPCADGDESFSGQVAAAVTICPAGAAGCVGLRAEAVRATNIWKNPLIDRAAADAPLHIGLAVSSVMSPVWLAAPLSAPLPRGTAAICLRRDRENPALAILRP